VDRKPAASPRFDSQERAFRAYYAHQARLEILSGRSSSKRAGNSLSGDHLSETFRVSGGINVLFDISGQKAVQEQQSMLVRELDHRIKNNLATIQAIAGTTTRNARSLDDFQRPRFQPKSPEADESECSH
jgi:two-component sensor histidine kinase